MTYVKISKENINSVKNELIKLGYEEDFINDLEPGCYRYDGKKIEKISEDEFRRETRFNVDLYSVGGGIILGGCEIYTTNKKLHTSMYSCKNEQGKQTGHGYAFEDICNMILEEAGFKVDTQIGKTCEKGGPDAIITKDGRSTPIQYKCSNSPKHTAEIIEKRNSYHGQLICTNKELTEPLREEIKGMEQADRVEQATNARIFDINVGINQAKEVAKFGTPDSILFDAKTATSTGIVSAITAGMIKMIIETKKQGGFNKEVVKKSVKYGVAVGAGMFIIHIAINQLKRL